MPAITPVTPLNGGNIYKPVSIKGTTATVAMVVQTIAPGILVPGAHIKVRGLFSAASSNGKTFQFAINDGDGGSSGATLFFSAGGITLNGAMLCEADIFILDSTTQKSGILNSTSGVGTVTSPPVLTNKNTANGLDLCVLGALATSSDSMTLEAFGWEVSPL